MKKIYENGDQYEGEFKDDNMNGQGVLTYPNGNCYKGEWKNNQFLG